MSRNQRRSRRVRRRAVLALVLAACGSQLAARAPTQPATERLVSTGGYQSPTTSR